MRDPESDALDDSEILQEAFEEPEEPMNAKNVGWGPTVVVGLVVGGGSTILSHWLDAGSSKEAVLNNTVSTLVEVKTEVAGLTEQVKQLREQPYVRREEYEARLSGLDRRVSDVERN